MMSNKQTNNFFEVDIKFALGYCPFFIMVGVDTGLPEQKKNYLKTHHLVHHWIPNSMVTEG